ncbi:MAG TPA: AraC family transcriptional regulator [Cyclobacteriaceae bacterium]|nr:AraC family transcriptional regulator [Cyclobacteriaceae bacterium]
MKALKVPHELVNAPYYHRDLKLNGLSIVESCTHTFSRTGSMFLEDHMLLVVLEGTNTITHGKKEFLVRKNEMVLLKKAIQIDYHKVGNPENNNAFDSMMFFLKDEFIIDFMKMAKVESTKTAEIVTVAVKPVKERLGKFVDSIKTYFSEPENIDGGLMRLKMLELLYALASTDKNILQQIIQLKQQIHADIPSVVEDNYANPVSLADLAYLSGRSLSSFKRDFFAIYQATPAQWIRDKRLSKARELLATDMTVKDVCFSLGFENVAHFSRLFKSHFGYTPSSVRIATT